MDPAMKKQVVKKIEINSDLSLLLSIFLIGLYVGFARLEFSQAEDFGVFLSVFGFVAKGVPLYSGIFEIKDPLFLLSGATLVSIFGPSAPFFLDVFLISISGPIAYISARNMKFGYGSAIFAALIFILTLTGGFYGSIRSTLFATVLVVLSLGMAAKNRLFLAGFLVACVGGFKMPYLLTCVPVGIYIFNCGDAWGGFKKISLGFIFGCAIIGFILIIRGEFLPYVNMIAENFSYRDSYMEVIGRPSGIRGHLDTMYSVGVYPQILVLVTFIVGLYSALRIKTVDSKFSVICLISLAIAALVYLLLTAMWPHHFQILALFAWPISLLILQTIGIELESFDSEVVGQRQGNGGFEVSLNTFKAVACITFSLASILVVCGASKTIIDIKPKVSIDNLFSHQWTQAPEIRALNDAHEQFGGIRSFARLGVNDDSGFGLFIGRDWKLSCPRTGQYGQESPNTVKDILQCIENMPNYVVASPIFYSMKRFSGPYNSFKEKMLDLLARKFDCYPVSNWTGGNICVRKDLVK